MDASAAMGYIPTLSEWCYNSPLTLLHGPDLKDSLLIVRTGVQSCSDAPWLSMWSARRFAHLNIEMAGRFLKIGKCEIPFDGRDVTDLIEARHRVANMRRIGHRLFARSGKGECRGWQ